MAQWKGATSSSLKDLPLQASSPASPPQKDLSVCHPLWVSWTRSLRDLKQVLSQVADHSSPLHISLSELEKPVSGHPPPNPPGCLSNLKILQRSQWNMIKAEHCV